MMKYCMSSEALRSCFSNIVLKLGNVFLFFMFSFEQHTKEEKRLVKKPKVEIRKQKRQTQHSGNRKVASFWGFG